MLPMPRERMFIGYDDDLTPEEVTSLLSEGRLWLALQLYDDEQPDQALSELRDLPQAIASYTAAQVIIVLRTQNILTTIQWYLTAAQLKVHINADCAANSLLIGSQHSREVGTCLDIYVVSCYSLC